MVPVDSVRISRVPTYSGYQTNLNIVHVRDYHPILYHFPMDFHFEFKLLLWSYNPKIAETNLVWANPFSIASTRGITIVFSSSGYLDVSVLRVSFIITNDVYSSNRRVIPFGHLGIDGHLHLHQAFRSLSRPSSPLRA